MTPTYRVIFAGNPNVGKSTVFNALTGLKQHTGNWSGKTVDLASGNFKYDKYCFELKDLPGTYSIISNSPEEEIARDAICFGDADFTVVVADATCLTRNLNLVLQILEITPKVVLCVNLLDEAERKNIYLDLDALERRLGIPVIGISARNRRDIQRLKAFLTKQAEYNFAKMSSSIPFTYPDEIENAIYYCTKYGVINHMARMKIDKGFYKEHLYGIAYFVKMVDKVKGEKYLSQLDNIDWPI